LQFVAYPCDIEKYIQVDIIHDQWHIKVFYCVRSAYGSNEYESTYQLFSNWIDNIKSFIIDQAQNL
jgi:hypothetical protein